MIAERYCDTQMATKKNYLKYCKKSHCRRCPCCVEVDDQGQKKHVGASYELNYVLYVPKPLKGKIHEDAWDRY